MKKIREDIEFKEYAESLGWRAIVSTIDQENCHSTPNLPYDFRRGDFDLWLTGRGWCIAELIDNKYENHRYFRYLKEALIN